MCGIVGIHGSPEAAREAFLALTILQHRGQDAAGILSYDNEGFHRVKNLGLVENVFTKENTETLKGSTAIGHTRYATIGRGDLVDVQPFLLSYPFGLGMVHNGNIVNTEALTEELKVQYRRNILSHSDTEVVLNVLAEALATSVPHALPPQDEALRFDQVCEAVKTVFQKVNGSYSIITLVADHGLLAFRDPFGIRPMVWGKRTEPDGKPAYMVASESAALTFNGYEVVEYLKPGQVLYIDLKGGVHSRVVSPKTPSPCMFEWVYFASAESEIDHVPVYGARSALGRNLGRIVKEKLKAKGLEADVVAPVPDTSRTSAIALAEELGVPYREALIKNRYIKRTFILATEDRRKKAVNLKLSPVLSEIVGKRVLLVDDSIVRGTTSKKIIELVRRAGAKAVYFVSTCPPIRYPCFYGIDFPSAGELIAHNRTAEEIEKELGADAVIYQDVEGLKTAIQKDNPCMACLDGRYPTDVKAYAARFEKLRTDDRRVAERD